MRWRELVAAVVVVVGGTLWLIVPDPPSGSLQDRSVIARWRVPPGRAFAAWIVVRNQGPNTIELTGASVGSTVPADAELLGAHARLGAVPTVERTYPIRSGPFFRLEGFEIPPGRNATIGFGIAVPDQQLVRLERAVVTYRERGEEQDLQVRHTARLCVRVSRGGCSA